MPLAPDEVNDWRKTMGKLKPMFDIEVMPHVEKCRLEMAMPIRQAGIIAAQVYLDGKDKATTHIKATVLMPIAIILMVVVSLALIAWGMK